MKWPSLHPGLLVLVLVIVLVAAPFLFSFLIHPPPIESQFLRPEFAYLTLERQIHDGEPMAVLSFTSFVGGGCDSASDLRINYTYEPDALRVHILGYDFEEGNPGILGTCPAVALKSQGSVFLNNTWIQQAGTKRVLVEMREEQNRYSLSYEECLLSLAPVNVSNVRSYTSESGYSGAVNPLAVEVTLYGPEDCKTAP